MRIVFLILISILVSGCTSWNYRVTNENVAFEIRSWNHDPIIKNVEKADSATFMNLGKGYGADRDRVFYKGNEIPNVDPKTFVHMEWAYSKDSKNVFLHTCQLESANPNEFRILGGSWSKDKENVYHGYELVHADAKSFQFLGNNWAVDKMNAYHALSSVSLGCSSSEHLQVTTFKGTDIESFKVIDGFRAKDKHGEYNALKSPNKRVN